MGLFDYIKKALNQNKDKNKYLSGFKSTNNKIEATLNKIDVLSKEKQESFMEELMITLLEADVGYETSKIACDLFYGKIQELNFVTKRDIKYKLYETFYEIYKDREVDDLKITKGEVNVILMSGVNGAGKTTTSAKIAHQLKNQGYTICLVAADTFRAGAVKQLEEWSKIVGVDFFKGKDGEDPSSVLISAARYCKEKNIDVMICDTAGRLQNKVNLMNELDKMIRVIKKEIPNAPSESLLVIDANTGQNGINQAKLFNEITNLTGVILTKMDGTSKGGIILGIKNTINVPVRFIGLGEKIDDLSKFSIEMYLYSLIGEVSEYQ